MSTHVYSVQLAAFDPVAPDITAIDVPATATAGQAVTMSAAATDRVSGTTVHFDFGDGGGADATSAQHVYGAAGTFTVTVSATDAAGNAASTTRSVVVAPAPAVPGGGGSGAGGNGANAGGGVAGPKRLTSSATLTWDRLSDGRTRLTTLVIEGLRGPETVKLRCVGGKAKGCRAKARATVKKHARQVKLTKYLAGMTLRPGAQLVVTVS